MRYLKRDAQSNNARVRHRNGSPYRSVNNAGGIVDVKISGRGKRDEEIAIINGPMFLDPARIKLAYHDRRYACRHVCMCSGTELREIAITRVREISHFRWDLRRLAAVTKRPALRYPDGSINFVRWSLIIAAEPQSPSCWKRVGETRGRKNDDKKTTVRNMPRSGVIF